MDLLSNSARHRPRVLLRLNRAPQTRLYSKETINRRLRGGVAKQWYPREPRHPPRGSRYPPLQKIEAFGKPRDPSSNAAKEQRWRASRRLEKALLHEHHGENIYAYVHLRTGQVVYSLTKIMDVCMRLSSLPPILILFLHRNGMQFLCQFYAR